VLVGGRSEAALRRAGRYGDGYLSYVLTPERIGSALDVMRREAEGAGRDPSSLTSAHLVFITVRPTYEAALDEAAGIPRPLPASPRPRYRRPPPVRRPSLPRTPAFATDHAHRPSGHAEQFADRRE
jgi:alkanesulfonate monooxygenase SsuD/methylene tetrahydromethanopterin reductase-like flavin-dependent oxidoreductase (luciferase family)